MTTDDNADLLTFIHPANGPDIPHEVTQEALRAAYDVFFRRQIMPAAAISAWHARDQYTQTWVLSAPIRPAPLSFDEYLATIQPPNVSQGMKAAAQIWDDAQEAATKAVLKRVPTARFVDWLFERVPSPDQRRRADVRRRSERF